MTRQEFEKRVMVIAGSPGCKVPDEAHEWIDATLKVAAEVVCYFCGRGKGHEPVMGDKPPFLGSLCHNEIGHMTYPCHAYQILALRQYLNEGRR